jgi:23S rRNA pseudouridine1911/1915/1917 synthase
MRWVVPSGWDGERFDRVLAHLGAVSRSAARTAIEAGDVTLDGEVSSPSTGVTTGSVLEGEIRIVDTVLAPEPVPFEVRFEDDHVAVVDKPAGIVTHPGAGNATGTLAAGILHRWPSVRGVGADDRWGIVHRLDRDTSGLLVVALTHEAHAALSAAIKRREVTREYVALVVGVPQATTGTVDAPILRDPRRPTRMRVHTDGRASVTHYRVEEALGDLTLLRVALETGRTHQIRVHLASIGLPVAGDRVYGNGRGSGRLFLHAARLAFDHPISGDRIDVVSPLPEDLLVTLEGARSGP